jgi:hemerythrin-like domain-containing protein
MDACRNQWRAVTVLSQGISTPTAKERIMARSKSGAASRSQPLAIELLLSDHRKVEDLFDRYESEKDGDESTKQQLAQQICNELKVHTQVEEELFYPWLRENLDEDDMEMVEEATVEHQSAKDLIAQIEGGGEIDDAFDAKVKVLGEYIKHHVKEEEGEIFPEVRDEQEELDELGQEMAARKEELMEELGMEPEEGEGGMAASGAQRSRGKGGESTTRGSR